MARDLRTPRILVDTASWEDVELPSNEASPLASVEYNPQSLTLRREPAISWTKYKDEASSSPLARHDSACSLGRPRLCGAAKCMRPPRCKEPEDNAAKAEAPPRRLRSSKGPAWLCGAASFEQPEDSPREWEAAAKEHILLQNSEASREWKAHATAAAEMHILMQNIEAIRQAEQQRPAQKEAKSRSASRSKTAKLGLAMHDSTSSLQYVASEAQQGSPAATLEQQQEDIRRANAEGSGLEAEWLIDPADIYFCAKPNGKLCRLGRGTFGTVYQGVWNGEMVAVKVCRKAHVTDKAMESFVKEVAILHGHQNNGLVQFKGACCWKDGRRTVLVTEFMENGDLCTALGRSPHRFSWHALGKGIALDIARALAFLHSRNIVHFDLKSANILLDRHNCAKLADVGLAKSLTDTHGSENLCTFMSTGDIGTFAWAAPEVLMGFPCNHSADIFSFGVLIWELCTSEMPQGRCLRPLRVPEECSQSVSNLMMTCLRSDPDMRPTADDLVTLLSSIP